MEVVWIFVGGVVLEIYFRILLFIFGIDNIRVVFLEEIGYLYVNEGSCLLICCYFFLIIFKIDLWKGKDCFGVFILLCCDCLDIFMFKVVSEWEIIVLVKDDISLDLGIFWNFIKEFEFFFLLIFYWV